MANEPSVFELLRFYCITIMGLKRVEIDRTFLFFFFFFNIKVIGSLILTATQFCKLIHYSISADNKIQTIQLNCTCRNHYFANLILVGVGERLTEYLWLFNLTYLMDLWDDYKLITIKKMYKF